MIAMTPTLAMIVIGLAGCSTLPTSDSGPAASSTTDTSPAAVRGDDHKTEESLRAWADKLEAWEHKLRNRERELEAWERAIDEREHRGHREDRNDGDDRFHGAEEILGEMWHELEGAFHRQQEEIGHRFETMHERFRDAMHERAAEVDDRFRMIREMAGDAMGRQADEFSHQMEEMMERMHDEMRHRDHVLEEAHHRIDQLERMLMEVRGGHGMNGELHPGDEMMIFGPTRMARPLPGIPRGMMRGDGPDGVKRMEEERRGEGNRGRGQRRGSDRDREDARRGRRGQVETGFEMDLESNGTGIMMMDGRAFEGGIPADMMNVIMELIGEAMDENGVVDAGEASVRVITGSMSALDDDDEEAGRGDRRRSRNDGKDKGRKKSKSAD